MHVVMSSGTLLSSVALGVMHEAQRNNDSLSCVRVLHKISDSNGKSVNVSTGRKVSPKATECEQA